jgi:20S proteasome subunit beta 7
MQNLVKEAYGPKVHSLGAVNVGTSVMGLKFKDGVILAADTAISYGGMKNLKDARRIIQLSDECAFACSGEMADAQNLQKVLAQKQESDEIEQDGATFLKPRDYYQWISRMNYQRRCKSNPLWVSTIIGGVRKDNGEAFLGMTDLYGTKIEH